MHQEPVAERLSALAGRRDDGPLVALNLNRYRARADYPDGTPDSEVTGREAYQRYGVVALAAIAQTGGRILWAANAQEVVIGCEHDRYHEVVAVWYPSRSAFLRLDEYPGYSEAFTLHRRAAIEHASLLFFEGTAEGQLRVAFGG